MGKPKTPKKTPEERALIRLQAAELSRTGDEINERKRRIIRGQMGGRSSLLSGSARGIRQGEVRLTAGPSNPGLPGRTGGTVGTSAGLGGFGPRVGGGGAGGRRGGSGRSLIP